MRSEGYGSWVCLSVKLHLTSGASVCPENTVTYSAGNKGQKICGTFSEAAPLQRSSTPQNHVHSTLAKQEFYVQKICGVFSEATLLQRSSTTPLKAYMHVRSATFLRKARMHIV